MSYFPLPSKPFKPGLWASHPPGSSFFATPTVFLSYCQNVDLPKLRWTWGDSNPRPNNISWDTLRFHL